MSLDFGPFEWRDAPAADFAVIGDPVAHSLSPRMHAAAYRALGLPYRYVAIRVDAGEVVHALGLLRSLGYRGVNVTVPHKEEALNCSPFPDQLAIDARAANTLRLADGAAINTDAPGFLDTLAGHHPHSALLLGAGGSARAIALALLSIGCSIRLYNRTRVRADELAASLNNPSIRVLGTPDPAGCQLVVNATSAAIAGSEVQVDWSCAGPKTLAYHLMYGPKADPFLRAAYEHGLRTMDGRALLAAQGARSFEWWLGIKPPVDVMFEALK